MFRGVVSFFVRLYLKLPFKPFRATLSKLYGHYYGHQLQADPIVRKKIKGITYELDLREQIDTLIYYQGSFEPATTAAICRLCEPGMVALDIGANIGAHTLRMAQLVGPDGKVIAFEPMTAAKTKLERNISLNPFTNIVVEKLALGNADTKKRVHFRTSWRLAGLPEQEEETSKELVTFRKLDTYAAQKRLVHVGFIKLDVDGLEFEILKGGRQSLKKWRPRLVMEVGDYPGSGGYRLEDLLTMLTDLGYELYDEKNLRPLPADRLRADLKRGTVNLVALPRT